MSYEPTIWRTGDKVTAEKLNKIEQAIVSDNKSIDEINQTVLDMREYVDQKLNERISIHDNGIYINS